jgi:hypothetical protein
MKYFNKKTYIVVAVAAVAYLFINPYYLFPDGQGYFSYLSSLFYDGDLDFYNDFVNMKIPVPLALTHTNYIANNWSFGTAFFWTPFYLTAKLLSETTVNPYGASFWFWVNAGTVFYGFITFFLLLMILRSLKYTGNTWLIAAAAFIGTPMFFYTFTISSTAHGITAFIASVFIWAWLYSMPNENIKNESNKNLYGRYVILGFLLGMAFMVRPQEALFGIVVLVELCFCLKNEALRVLKRLACFSIAFIAGASPQLIIWKIIYGSFYYAPSKFNVSLKYFSFSNTLFSSYHGILLWTPLFFVSFIGLLLGLSRYPKIFIGLFLAFLGQLFVNSCCVAYWEGYSFGLRQMVSSLPIAAIGLAEFWNYFTLRTKPVKAFGYVLITFPSLWAFGLLLNYYAGLDLLGYLPAKEIIHKQASIIYNLPELLKKFSGLARPQIGVFLGMLIFGFLFYLFFDKLRSIFERSKYSFIIVCLLIILSGYDIMIIKAHFNKPERVSVSKDVFVSPQELDGFFIKQVEEIKERYNLK